MNLVRYVSLFAAALREQARAEKAFLGNFWFGVLGKLSYNITFLVFIDQLFARVGHFAGFSKNDFMCMYFLSQVGFYTAYYGIFFAVQAMVDAVRNGTFDLLLLKPVPHRSFLYVRGMQPFDLLLTTTPSLVIMAFLIDWPALHITLGGFLASLVVLASGIAIYNAIVFALSLPVFTTGEATQLLNTVFFAITTMSQVPYSRLPSGMKIAAFVIFPQIIVAGITAEVLLGKTDPVGITAITAAVAVVAIVAAQGMWRFALRRYSSVSS